MSHERNWLGWSVGLVLLVLGSVTMWAGLNLPGTTGHDGSLSLTLLCLGLGNAALNYGALLMHASADEPVRRWQVWLNTIGGTVGFGLGFAGLIMRTNLSLGW